MTDKMSPKELPEPTSAENQQPGEAKKPRSFIGRLVKNTLRLIIYIPLLALITVALLIGTSFGSRITVMLANALVPNLDVVYHSGRLNKDLTLSQAHWSMNGVSVDATDLHLAWRPACLLNKQLCVNALDASSVKVVVTTSAFASDPSEPTTPPEPDAKDEPLRLPFSITLSSADLNKIQVSVDKMRFNAEQLQTSADWPESGIRVHQLAAKGLLVDIPLSSDDPAATPSEPNADAKLEKPVDDTAKWAMANLPKAYNPVPVIVDDLKLTDSTLILGKRKDSFSKLSLQGEYLGTKVNIKNLDASHTLGSAKLKGNIELDHHYPMNIELQAQLNPNALLKGLGKQGVKLDIQGDFSALKVKGSGLGDTDFSLDADANLANPDIPYQLALSAKALRWPLKQPEYQAHRLTLHTRGDLNNQSAVVSGDISTPFYPQTQFASELKHTNGTLDMPHLQLVSGDATLYLTGKLDYDTQDKLHLDWLVSLDGKQLNPALVQLPGKQRLPKGRITAQLSTQGKLDGNNWLVDVPTLSLYGLLDGYPLDLSGGVSIDNKLHITANDLHLKALGASLTAKGSTGEHWDLKGHLNVPDLAPWMKDAAGSITADLTVTGKEDAPRLNMDGQLNGIKLQQATVDKLGITAWLDLMGNHSYNLALGAEGVSYEENDLKTVTLWSQGDIAKQSLSLTSQGEVRLDTRIDSEYLQDKEEVKANISQLDIASVIGDWKLNKAINLDWQLKDNLGLITAFCLTDGTANLCLDKETQISDSGNASISFAGDPGAIIAPLIPPQIKWHGPMKLDTKLAWQPQQRPSANLLLQLEPGTVTVTRKEQAPANIQYHGGQLAGLLENDQLTLNADIDAGTLASLSSRLQVNVSPDRTLKGEIDIDHLELSGLQAFVPQIETLAGTVASNIRLSGSLNKPEAAGKLTLSKGSFSAAANPTLVENIEVSMNFAGRQAELDGKWNMGQGEGKLGGSLDWQSGQARGEITIKGDALEVIAPPVAIVKVSPDLTINLSPNGTHVAGTIQVPDGDIQIVQMAAGGVPLSPDVVFQDSISAKAAKAKPYPISVELNIKVDDKVSIKGMGLSGNLTGTLTLQQQPSRPPLLFGEVQVLNGSYRFLGQRLKISTGELQFVGPAANPNLNIEAVRVVKDDDGDVTAGIRVTGTPSRPVVTLFSNPSMEQAEILSYIIKGSGFNNKEQNDALMMSAALTLSSQLADGAIGNIGNAATSIAEKIGISDIQLDANDDGKVAISGYIGDRLMVKYGIGVFNPGYELTVRYYLLTRLYLEAVSGSLDQSLDLYYSFDLD